MTQETVLAVIVGLGGLFFLSAVVALYWAAKRGQMQNFEAGAKTVFDESEPEGQVTDKFPERRPKHSA